MVTTSSLRFDSSDLERTEAFLSWAYTKMHITGRAERTRTVLARESAASLSIDAISFEYDMTHDAVAPIGKLCVVVLHEGGVERRYLPDGTEGTFGAGDVFMYVPHDRPYQGVIRQARYDSIMFDPLVLGQVLAEDPGEEPQLVRLATDRAIPQAAARQLRRVVVHVRDGVLTDPLSRSAPLVAAAAEQLVAASVLSAFPYRTVEGSRWFADHTAHPAAVRRAVAFIDAHAAQPITLADIATACGVGGRALQAAFRRHHDLTPMEYLRRVRLDGVHHDLMMADPTQGATVADIARRWGFTPSSRFASFYRAQYGISPSATLRQ